MFEFPPLISFLAPHRQQVFAVLFLINTLRLIGEVDLDSITRRKNEYNHQGVSQMLAKCLEVYNFMLELENEIDVYNKTIDRSWRGLKPEVERYEKSLDAVLANLSTYQTEYRTMGAMWMSTKDLFKEKLLESLLPEMVQNITTIITKKDHLIQMLVNQTQKVVGSLSSFDLLRQELISALTELSQRGLRLGGVPQTEEGPPRQFDVSALEEIHSLFIELDDLHLLQLERPSSDFAYFYDWETYLDGRYRDHEFRRMKFHDIPVVYQLQQAKLAQFAPWVDQTTQEIMKGVVESEVLSKQTVKEMQTFLIKVGMKSDRANFLIKTVNQYPVVQIVDRQTFYDY